MAIPMKQATNDGRSFAIELAKFVAAYAVVMIHLVPTTPNAELITDVLRLFPVPFFFVSAIYFTIPGALKKGTVSGALSFSRLIRPYMIWTVFYLLMRWVKKGDAFFAMDMKEWFGIVFIGGAAVQLYFLPLLVFFQILAASSALLFSSGVTRQARQNAACWFVGALLTACVVEYMGSYGLYFLTNGLIYAVLGSMAGALNKRVHSGWAGVLAIAVVVMAGLAWIAYSGIKLPDYLTLPFFGCAVLLLLLRVRTSVPPRWMERLVSCYFGIYLTHHFIEEGLEMVCARLGHSLTPYDVSSRLGVALVAFCGGIAATLMLRLSPRVAYWTLGEKPVEAKRVQPAPKMESLALSETVSA